MPRQEHEYQQLRTEARNKIIDSAILVFANKGYAKTTITDIANNANISVGLMYRYFKSKQQLFDTIIEYAIAGVNEAIAYLSANGNPKETLFSFCQTILDNMSDKTYINLNLMFIFCLLAKDTDSYQRVIAVDQMMFIATEKLIKLGQNQGVFQNGNPTALTSLLFSTIQGMVLMKTGFSNYFKQPTADELLLFLVK